MSRVDEGLRSDELRSALELALGGDRTRLEWLLARHGGLPAPRPNVKLAAAFGEELAGHGSVGLRLALELADAEVDGETREAFFPVAAAFALCALERRNAVSSARERRALDDALAELAADERRIVRVGAVAALTARATREGGADTLVRWAEGWIVDDDRERSFATSAAVLEVLGDRNVLAELRDADGLFAFLDRALDLVEKAPRSAERSPGRRRILTSLPLTFAALVPSVRGADEWLAGRCASVQHPDLRETLGLVLDKLKGGKVGGSALDALENAFEASRPPPRDPTKAGPEARRKGRRKRR
ncbi:MAG: hypothetical protein H6721_22895 [Sandaracinus sp.]|nr:hypothetical protein [Myxococcales bacterium]MCB9604137.1 hypothetical protein [Sandaracinus sp.]MCB9615102.1 hypothetical protein [Sandaracinus sp.]MCB9634982.1 hypothetical protein [Sandaracinus sp.]